MKYSLEKRDQLQGIRNKIIAIGEPAVLPMIKILEDQNDPGWISESLEEASNIRQAQLFSTIGEIPCGESIEFLNTLLDEYMSRKRNTIRQSQLENKFFAKLPEIAAVRLKKTLFFRIWGVISTSRAL